MESARQIPVALSIANVGAVVSLTSALLAGKTEPKCARETGDHDGWRVVLCCVDEHIALGAQARDILGLVLQ